MMTVAFRRPRARLGMASLRSYPNLGIGEGLVAFAMLSISGSRLTEAGARDLHVCLKPYLPETSVGRDGFFLFTLPVEALRETEERPAVFRQAREVVSIHLFRLSKAALLHERGAE
jgi:hypothetical protein